MFLTKPGMTATSCDQDRLVITPEDGGTAAAGTASVTGDDQ
jgi:hypothetical protein